MLITLCTLGAQGPSLATAVAKLREAKVFNVISTLAATHLSVEAALEAALFISTSSNSNVSTLEYKTDQLPENG